MISRIHKMNINRNACVYLSVGSFVFLLRLNQIYNTTLNFWLDFIFCPLIWYICDASLVFTVNKFVISHPIFVDYIKKNSLLYRKYNTNTIYVTKTQIFFQYIA